MSLNTCECFPQFLASAREIEVKDGEWTGIFSKISKQSEGWPIFKKVKGIKETWQLKKENGIWTFFNYKMGRWIPKEQWNPPNVWVTQNGTVKNISIRVTKSGKSSGDDLSDKSWGDNLVRTMWEQGTAYDMKIKLQDGEEIDAHKAVIAAACPAWKGLLESSMVEAQSGVIAVTDINPNVVKGFVKALYYGEFEDQTLLPGIALMADRYNTEQLMDKVVLAMPQALATEGPDFYFKVVETLKRLPDTENKRKLKEMLFTMNKDISKDVFYKRLGIN